MTASASKGAAVFAGSLTQTGVNVDTWVQIPTGIDPGSGTVIELESLDVFFRNAHTAITCNLDQLIMVSVSRSPVVPSLANTDVFGMVAIAAAAVGAIVTANQAIVDVVQNIDLEPALTLQPYVYVCLSSLGLASTATIDYRVSYQTSKVSQAEQLKLLAGGV